MINCVINDVDDVCEVRNKVDELFAGAVGGNGRKNSTPWGLFSRKQLAM